MTRSPPEQQLKLRDNLDHDAKKRYVLSSLISMRRIARAFIEFTEECLGETKSSDGHGTRYFTKNGPLPTRDITRKFLIYYTDSRAGRGTEADSTSSRPSLSLVTVVNMFITFYSTITYFNRPLESAVTSDTRPWICTELANEQKLNLQRNAKPFAYGKDVSTIIRCLFDPGILHAFRSLKYIPYTLLCINLLLDASGRIGELCPPHPSKRFYDPLEEVPCWHWGDIEIYAFPHPDRAECVEIWVMAWMIWLKGSKLSKKEWKKSVFRMLPTEWALEDTCRLLLVTALIEGHIEDLDSWDALMKPSPSPEGTLIPLKESSKTLPVLRLISRYGDTLGDPHYDSLMFKTFKLLGRRAGFTQDLTSYALRRGIGYLLETTQGERVRRRHTGHGNDSRAYSPLRKQDFAARCPGPSKESAPGECSSHVKQWPRARHQCSHPSERRGSCRRQKKFYDTSMRCKRISTPEMTVFASTRP
jgi:hypothetical protein